MNDEQPLGTAHTKNRRRLEERLGQHLELLERLHEIVDTLERSVADGSNAHEAEDRVVEEIRKLGRSVLGQWAHEAKAQIQSQVPSQHLRSQKHGKRSS